MLASRISYVGELGWELHVPIEQGARLWDALWEAGQPHGLVPAGIGVYGTTGRLEKGYRAFGAELTADYTLVEAGMTRPKVKEQAFIGKEAYLRQRAEPPCAVLCTLTVDSHTSADGTPRYMLGGEPILSPAGERLVDAKGRPSYVTSAGSGPSVGKHLLMAYLPADHAVEGNSLLVEYMGEQYPVTVAVAGVHPAVRPRERAGQELAGMEILVCVKRVPTVGGKIAVTPDGQEVDTRMSGFSISPHEECAVEEAVQITERVGGTVSVLTLGPEAAIEQLRGALALGAGRAVLLETDGREFGPIATAAAIAAEVRAPTGMTWCCWATRRPTPATTRSASGSRTSSAGRWPPGSRTCRCLRMAWSPGGSTAAWRRRTSCRCPR